MASPGSCLTSFPRALPPILTNRHLAWEGQAQGFLALVSTQAGLLEGKWAQAESLTTHPACDSEMPLAQPCPCAAWAFPASPLRLGQTGWIRCLCLSRASLVLWTLFSFQGNPCPSRSLPAAPSPWLPDTHGMLGGRVSLPWLPNPIRSEPALGGYGRRARVNWSPA